MKAITFDLWNTIFKNHFYNQTRFRFFADFLKNKGISISKEKLASGFKKGFYLSELNIEDIGYRHIHTEERIKNLFKFLGLEQNSNQISTIKEEFESFMLEDPPDLKSGVIKTLNQTSNNYRIGLISNTGVTPGKIIEKVLEKYEILKYFDSTVYSDEIGVYKPHPKIFRMALKELQSSPGETLHVGDILETDIKGAKNLGMKAVWIENRNIKPSEDLMPNYKITRLDELLKILKTLLD
ncbi:MAG: putative HAD-hydrolase [Promethearchaeota archaeon]|nr:MAG: putative HAD-hydrolase [Candidatus Lokiarchaeota archaeon]